MNYSWKDLAEILGVVAIVASLIFVGLQLKQSHEIALAGQYQARADSSLSLHLALQESGTSIQEILTAIPPGGISHKLRMSKINFTNFAWFSFDNHHFQYQSGFLTEESWSALSKRIENVYANCELRTGWDRIKYAMREPFVVYVESLKDSCGDMENDDA